MTSLPTSRKPLVQLHPPKLSAPSETLNTDQLTSAMHDKVWILKWQNSTSAKLLQHVFMVWKILHYKLQKSFIVFGDTLQVWFNAEVLIVFFFWYKMQYNGWRHPCDIHMHRTINKTQELEPLVKVINKQINKISWGSMPWDPAKTVHTSTPPTKTTPLSVEFRIWEDKMTKVPISRPTLSNKAQKTSIKKNKAIFYFSCFYLIAQTLQDFQPWDLKSWLNIRSSG